MKKGIAIGITVSLLLSMLVLVARPENAMAMTNNLIGEYTIFSQNYTVKGVTNNMFLANPYGSGDIHNSTLTYDTNAKAVRYRVWMGNTMQLYIGKLYPAVKATYKITLSMDTDNYNAATNIRIGQAWFNIKYSDESFSTMKINVFYKNAVGDTLIKYTTFPMPADKKVTIDVSWDGTNKTNHITCEQSGTVNIWVPASCYDVQKLPYNAITWPFVNIYVVLNKATYADVYLYKLEEMIPRYTITAMPQNNLEAFGFDGPRDYAAVHKAMEYLKNYSYRATLFFSYTVRKDWVQNLTIRDYYRELINKYGWESGIHFTKRLEFLSWINATALMTTEYNEVTNIIGVAPESWCSMADDDNVSHAIYAWNNFRMYWRNGNTSLHAIPNVGGLNLNTWHFWDIASQHGFVFPVFVHNASFVHESARDCIDYTNFTKFVDRAKQNGLKIVPFIDYFKINLNQVDFYATNIERGDCYLKFTAHTNGAVAYVDVAFPYTINVKVYDETAHKYIDWKSGCVQFWVEDGHTYKVYYVIHKSMTHKSIDILSILIPIIVPVGVVWLIVLYFKKHSK